MIKIEGADNIDWPEATLLLFYFITRKAHFLCLQKTFFLSDSLTPINRKCQYLLSKIYTR